MLTPYIFDFKKLVDEGGKFDFRARISTLDLDDALSVLANELSSPLGDFDRMTEMCFRIVSGVPLLVNIYENSFILRARPNLNGEVFRNVSEIDINLNTEKVNLGRFNLPKSPVFYGADPIINETFDAYLTAISEAGKPMFDEKSSTSTFYFTVGKFNLLKPLKVILLSYYDPAEKSSTYISKINKFFNKYFETENNRNEFEKCKVVYRFFSERAGRRYDNDNGYLLTTAFFSAIQKYYGPEVGILYSSSATDNQGLNLVFTREVSTAGFLKFEKACMIKAVRYPNAPKQFSIFPCSSEALAENDGTLRFQNII